MQEDRAVSRRRGRSVREWVLTGLGAVLILSFLGVTMVFVTSITTLSRARDLTAPSSTDEGIIETFTPAGVVKQFYSDVEAQAFNSAEGYLAPDLASRYSAADLESKWQAFEAGEGPMAVIVHSITGNGRAGGVAVNTDGSHNMVAELISSSNNKSFRIALRLEPSDGSWLIQEADPGLIPEP